MPIRCFAETRASRPGIVACRNVLGLVLVMVLGCLTEDALGQPQRGTVEVTPPAPDRVAPVESSQFEFPQLNSPRPDRIIKPRQPHVKPAQVVFRRGLYPDRVVVKLVDGLAAVPTRPTSETARPGLAISVFAATRLRTSVANARAIKALNDVLGASTILTLQPLFTSQIKRLRELRRQAEQLEGREHAFLENYFWITLRRGADGARLAEQLNTSPLVEIAFLPPIPRDADIPPATPDFEPTQGYLNGDANGIDARFAWTRSGGRGRNMRIIDIEGSWNLEHEDFPDPFHVTVTPLVNEFSDSSHGTKVLGVLIARNDQRGITGITSDAGTVWCQWRVLKRSAER